MFNITVSKMKIKAIAATTSHSLDWVCIFLDFFFYISSKSTHGGERRTVGEELQEAAFSLHPVDLRCTQIHLPVLRLRAGATTPSPKRKNECWQIHKGIRAMWLRIWTVSINVKLVVFLTNNTQENYMLRNNMYISVYRSILDHSDKFGVIWDVQL